MPVAMGRAYYCELCKTRVDWYAKSCPLCGVSFSGVKCSKCEKIGSSHEFLNGCPQCGNLGGGSLVGEATGRAVVLKGNGGREGNHRPWHSSLYWFLSVLIIVIVGFIAAYWLKH